MAGGQRIDKWLFFARIAKSRTLAQSWIEAGHVTVNGEKMRRTSADIRPGDRVEVVVERRTHFGLVVNPDEGLPGKGYFEKHCFLEFDTELAESVHAAQLDAVYAYDWPNDP